VARDVHDQHSEVEDEQNAAGNTNRLALKLPDVSSAKIRRCVPTGLDRLAVHSDLERLANLPHPILAEPAEALNEDPDGNALD